MTDIINKPGKKLEPSLKASKRHPDEKQDQQNLVQLDELEESHSAADLASIKVQHKHDQSAVLDDQNLRAIQDIKTQIKAQNESSAFRKGDAQAHQQGNKQK